MAKILGEYINPDMGFQEPPAVFSGADLSNYPVGRQNPFWHRQFEKIEFEGFGLVDEKDWPELIGCKEPKTLPLFIEGHPFIVVCDPATVKVSEDKIPFDEVKLIKDMKDSRLLAPILLSCWQGKVDGYISGPVFICGVDNLDEVTKEPKAILKSHPVDLCVEEIQFLQYWWGVGEMGIGHEADRLEIREQMVRNPSGCPDWCLPGFVNDEYLGRS